MCVCVCVEQLKPSLLSPSLLSPYMHATHPPINTLMRVQHSCQGRNPLININHPRHATCGGHLVYMYNTIRMITICYTHWETQECTCGIDQISTCISSTHLCLQYVHAYSTRREHEKRGCILHDVAIQI